MDTQSKTQSEPLVQTPSLEDLKNREVQIFNELGTISVQLHLLEEQVEFLSQRKSELIAEQRNAVETYNRTVAESEGSSEGSVSD